MIVSKKSSDTSNSSNSVEGAPEHFLSGLPVPVWPLRPVFSRLIRALSIRHPALFERLGGYGRKVFVIDPVDMPVVLQLAPDAFDPKLVPFARRDLPEADAVISGEFMSLVRLVSGKADGDALFFSRELVIKGDTEAVLALRNAIDDMDIDLAEEIENLLGPFGAPLKFARGQIEFAAEKLQKAQNSLLAPAFERIDKLEREIAQIKRGTAGKGRVRKAKKPESNAS